MPHEKTSAAVADKINSALAPPNDVHARQRLHEDDEQTAWFGESSLADEYIILSQRPS